MQIEENRDLQVNKEVFSSVDNGTEMIPKLQSGIKILPIDTSSTFQKYIVTTSSGRQFEISNSLKEFLELIDGKKTKKEIATILSKTHNLDFTSADIENIIKTHLVPQGLLTKGKGAYHQHTKQSYIYIKKNLFSQKTIRPITNILHHLFAPIPFFSLLSVVIVMHIYFYVFMQKPSFSLIEISGHDVLFVSCLILLTTLLHELGHLSACTHFGGEHGSIGIGLYMYMPVFYADVSDVWKLGRKERAFVDCGGMYFQLIAIFILFVLYQLFGHKVFLYTIYSLQFSIIISLNPFLRFDGYWLAVDLSGISNLRKYTQRMLQKIMRRTFFRSTYSSFVPLQIQPRTKIFLYVYTLFSSLFFVFFFCQIVFHIPVLLYSYPYLLKEFVFNLPQDITMIEFSTISNHLSKLLFPTLIFTMIAFMSYRLFSRLYAIIKNIIVNKLDIKQRF